MLPGTAPMLGSPTIPCPFCCLPCWLCWLSCCSSAACSLHGALIDMCKGWGLQDGYIPILCAFLEPFPHPAPWCTNSDLLSSAGEMLREHARTGARVVPECPARVLLGRILTAMWSAPAAHRTLLSAKGVLLHMTVHVHGRTRQCPGRLAHRFARGQTPSGGLSKQRFTEQQPICVPLLS